MHIALLGGSFNPPHMGHIWMGRQVLDFCGVDEVVAPPKPQSEPVKRRGISGAPACHDKST